jgi:hypothetical protein
VLALTAKTFAAVTNRTSIDSKTDGTVYLMRYLWKGP